MTKFRAPNSSPKYFSQQRGGALIIIMTILVVVMTSVFLSEFDSNHQILVKQQRNVLVLAKAKLALINFALLSDRVAGSTAIGYLPCPDFNGDGNSNLPCGVTGESSEGWLPWKTLGIPILRDASFTCLRYAVSGNYKLAPTSTLSNMPHTVGHFVIHDSTNTIRVGRDATEYALAVIFAPGSPHQEQSRTLGGDTATHCGSSALNATRNNAINYLDTLSGVNNALGTYNGLGNAGDQSMPTSNFSVFIQSDRVDGFNDQLLWVSPQDFTRVYARMP